jgi:hypothetical protein
VEVGIGTDRDGIPSRQPTERFGELIFSRHLGAGDQGRDDPDTMAKGLLDFNPNVIGWIMKSWYSIRSTNFRPVRADDDDHRVTLRNSFRDYLFKISAQRN